MPTPLPARRSVRLPPIAYLEGFFLVTMVAHRRLHRFGMIEGDEPLLSPLGLIVDQEWKRTHRIRPDVRSVVHVVMPNHVHAVLRLRSDHLPNPVPAFRRKAGSLSSIVAGFKASVTGVATSHGMPSPVWQRGFYERKLRSDSSLQAATAYVLSNPALEPRPIPVKVSC